MGWFSRSSSLSETRGEWLPDWHNIASTATGKEGQSPLDSSLASRTWACQLGAKADRPACGLRGGRVLESMRSFKSTHRLDSSYLGVPLAHILGSEAASAGVDSVVGAGPPGAPPDDTLCWAPTNLELAAHEPKDLWDLSLESIDCSAKM